jgi:muramoyltetrapeptide carboxypeptidase
MWKDLDHYTEENFWRFIVSAKKAGVLQNPDEEPVKILKNGKARGRLIGGNCSTLACLLGTPFLPFLKESILVLEDVDEAPHRVDRMLAQLLNAGILRRLSALVFGKFTECVPSDPSFPNLTIDQVQEEYAGKIQCPVIANFQYGHIPRKLTLPFGIRAAIDTKQSNIKVLESAVV